MYKHEVMQNNGIHFWFKHMQVSSANLERSYRRAPKGAGDKGTHDVAGAGVCHLCTCGQGVDWENLSFGLTIYGM